jgi:hypothetical protein
MHFTTLAAFINHLNGWLGPATALVQQPQHGNEYVVLTKNPYSVNIGAGITLRLDKESTVPAIRAFVQWLNQNPGVNLALGAPGTPTAPNVRPGNPATYWLPCGAAVPAPAGARIHGGYWRMTGLWWRP